MLQGIKNIAPNVEVKYAKGSNIHSTTDEEIQKATQIATESDIIVAVLGEDREMSGEAASRSDIRIPEA